MAQCCPPRSNHTNIKTFISDIIPRIQRFSQKLDNLTLLINQHWVVIDDSSDTKHVYIFRDNNELLISQNGRVEKAKWEYLGHDTLLIDRKDESLLLRHGFFDENILALKTDGKEEYALMVNETKLSKEINSTEKVTEFLRANYLAPTAQLLPNTSVATRKADSLSIDNIRTFSTGRGTVEIQMGKSSYVSAPGHKVLLNGKPAPTEKYKLGFMWYLNVKDGISMGDSII